MMNSIADLRGVVFPGGDIPYSPELFDKQLNYLANSLNSQNLCDKIKRKKGS